MSQLAQEISALNQQLQGQPPQAILEAALSRFDNLSISFSGAEDVVLVDMAARLGKRVQVFSLDTGRLHPETYRLFEAVRERYDIDYDILFPDYEAVQALSRSSGLFSFYEDGHKECCTIRKVAPLRRKLSTLDAWVTGQRRDQSPGTRTTIPLAELDGAFGSAEHPLVKFNPLADWSSAQVWDYIRQQGVPYNALHQQGFVSIGCEPCTRAVLPNQHEREGRWWWENGADKECGLHAQNLKVAANG